MAIASLSHPTVPPITNCRSTLAPTSVSLARSLSRVSNAHPPWLSYYSGPPRRREPPSPPPTKTQHYHEQPMDAGAPPARLLRCPALIHGGSFSSAGVAKERAEQYQGRVTIYVIITCTVAVVGGSFFDYDIGISGGVTSMDAFLEKFFHNAAQLL